MHRTRHALSKAIRLPEFGRQVISLRKNRVLEFSPVRPVFVRQLFDETAGTYELVNMASSFGFSQRWRQRCVRQLEIAQAPQVVDLMTGMGELCPSLDSCVGDPGNLIAIDISTAMCQQAKRFEDGRLDCPVQVLHTDALHIKLPAASADVIVSSFGLKTFSAAQIEALAQEVHR